MSKRVRNATSTSSSSSSSSTSSKSSSGSNKKRKGSTSSNAINVESDIMPLPSFVPGSVVKVEVIDFMTYKHCVFKPGPRINLVIGPNGVGKSSILCAVVLGLGGKPKLLGRQKLLANFVRRVDLNASNTDRAVIRITLKADPDDPSMDQDPMIERSFARGSSVSKWKINNKNSNQTEVDKIVRDIFQIRLDNLCMFLPQDIVGNFSQYTPQQILKETQLAILGESSVNKQEELQKLVDEDRHRDSKRKQLEAEKTKQQHLRDSQHAEVAAFLEYRKKKVALDKRCGKLFFLEFQEMQQRGLILKSAKKAARKAFDLVNKEYEPLQKDVDEIKKLVSKSVKTERKYTKAMEKADEKVKLQKRSITKTMYKHKSAAEDCQQKEIDIQKCEIKLNRSQKLKPKHQAELDEFPPQSELSDRKKELLADFKPEYNRLRKEQKKYDQQIYDKDDEKGLQKKKLSKVTKRLIEAQNIKKAKQLVLKTAAQHEKAGVIRTSVQCALNLNKFRNKLKGDVMGPMLLHINPKDGSIDKELACTIELAIGKRWRYAFAFTDVRDYHMLKRDGHAGWKDVTYALVKNQPVNQTKIERGRPVSSNDLKSMRDQGLVGYVDQLITAPPMVMELLYTKAGISRNMVGDSTIKDEYSIGELIKTVQSSAESRQGITSGSSSSSSSSGSKKRMKGTIRIITRQREAALRVTDYGASAGMINHSPHRENPTSILTKSEDKLLVARLSEEKVNIESEIERLESQIAIIRKQRLEPIIREQNEQKTKRAEVAGDIMNQLKERKDASNALKKVVRKIEQYEEELLDLQLELKDEKKDREKHKSDLWKLATPKEMEAKIKAFQSFAHANLDAAGLKIDLNEKKTKLEAMKSKNQDLVLKYEAARDALAAIIKEAKAKQAQAVKEINSHHVDYNDDNDDFYECDEKGGPPAALRGENGIWSVLSDDQDDLRAEIENLRKEVEATSNKRDKSILREFEITKEKLKIAIQKLDQFKKNASAGQKQLQDQIDEWTLTVKEVISKISFHFEKLMKGMNYDGRVQLTTEEDFKKIGVQISVQYREGEGKQPLSGGQHSGGERAVSTITYLLAVQQLTTAPLRMVDEINQGMDAINERHAYNAVGDICGTDQGKTQFWLFSPKLLMNEKRFRYPEDITVLLVQGGPHMIKSSEWNMEDIIEAQGKKVSGVNSGGGSKKKRKNLQSQGGRSTKKKK